MRATKASRAIPCICTVGLASIDAVDLISVAFQLFQSCRPRQRSPHESVALAILPPHLQECDVGVPLAMRIVSLIEFPLPRNHRCLEQAAMPLCGDEGSPSARHMQAKDVRTQPQAAQRPHATQVGAADFMWCAPSVNTAPSVSAGHWFKILCVHSKLKLD